MAELLTEEEITTHAAYLTGWFSESGAIVRTVEMPTFLKAIEAVDRVAVVAEELDHHPEIDIRWRSLTFTCRTHSAGGVTDKDFALARRIDTIIASFG